MNLTQERCRPGSPSWGKPEYTGVVAGMSGSPFILTARSLGAIAYRIGQFSKEPIAGVTPISQMLEINEFDNSIPQQGASAANRPGGRGKDQRPGRSRHEFIPGRSAFCSP